MIEILKGIGLILAVAVMIYLKYRRAKAFSDANDPEADIQTLFDGKK